jgi:hypothetical protein
MSTCHSHSGSRHDDENWPSILYEQINLHVSLTQWFNVEPTKQKGVCHTLWPLPFYIEKYLKGKKKNYEKFKYFIIAKIYISSKKKSSK